MQMENLFKDKKIIIICGHYGAGKTNIAVNLALHFKEKYNKIYKLVDLDIVNPYFRAADAKKLLEYHGIPMIIPMYANTNVDIPSVPPEIYSIFNDGVNAVIDVGGDDSGATALGLVADKIARFDYDMYYIVNKYRPLISNPNDAVDLARDIEGKSKLKITAVINNSNLGAETDADTVKESLSYANETAQKLGVPLSATTTVANITDGSYFIVKDLTKKYY